MSHPICHWEIATKDAAGLQEFYTKMFDWRAEHMKEMNYFMMHTGEKGSLGGGIYQATGDVPPYVTFYVLVDDLQAYLDKAVGLGAKAVVPPTPIPNIGSFAMFTDPQGNLIGLFKELAPAK